MLRATGWGPRMDSRAATGAGLRVACKGHLRMVFRIDHSTIGAPAAGRGGILAPKMLAAATMRLNAPMLADGLRSAVSLCHLACGALTALTQ